jgi:DNA-directed RNA polymerase subunit E'/Rpb7
MESIKHIFRDVEKTKQVGFPSSLLSSKNRINFKYNLNKLLEKSLKEEYENMCCNEGFVVPKSLKIIKRSNIRFPLESTKLTYVIDCTFKITVCCPYKDAVIHCEIVSKNKIGLLCKINAYTNDMSEEISPLIILVPNDLSTEDNDVLTKLQQLDTGDKVHVKVLGKKFEQFDKKITVVGQLVV